VLAAVAGFRIVFLNLRRRISVILVLGVGQAVALAGYLYLAREESPGSAGQDAR